MTPGEGDKYEELECATLGTPGHILVHLNGAVMGFVVFAHVGNPGIVLQRRAKMVDGEVELAGWSVRTGDVQIRRMLEMDGVPWCPHCGRFHQELCDPEAEGYDFSAGERGKYAKGHGDA